MMVCDSKQLLLWGCIYLLVGAQTSPSLDFYYHHYEALGQYLQDVANAYPNITNLYSIGETLQRKKLWVLEISTAPKSSLGIPNVKLIANIHGNEPAGREILLHLIQFFVTNYTSDDSVRWLLNSTRIHIMPSLNPDGFEFSIEGRCEIGPGRENVRLVDLNRSFPDYFQNNTKPRQRETQAVMDWLNTNTFVLSASLHGGALVANYPYENVRENNMRRTVPPSISPDDDVFRHLATVYASTHPTMHLGHSCNMDVDFPGGITNGAAWYPVTGGMQDYNYIYHGCMEVTLEISCCKYPLAHDLPSLWQDNKEALMKYVRQVHQGVQGLVLDNSTGEPIPKASLKIEGRESYFKTTSHGEFWRILLPGKYQLQVHAAGYEPQTVKFAVASNKNRTYYPTPKRITVNMSAVVRQEAAVSDPVVLPTNPPVTVMDDEASTLHHTAYQETVGLTEGHSLAPSKSTLFKDITPSSMELVKLSNTVDAESGGGPKHMPMTETIGSGGTTGTGMKSAAVVTVSCLVVYFCICMFV